MKRNRARKGSPRCHSFAIPLVPTLLGLLLVTAGLGLPVARPSVTASGRQFDTSPSSRSVRNPNRRWLALEEQEASVEAPLPLAVGGDTVPPAIRELAAQAAIIPTPGPTAIPIRTEVITYTVQPGDNVYLISLRFNITQDTLIWANDRLEMDPDLLSIGEDLAILPVNGVWHTVKAGETLASIASRYKVTQDAIVDYKPNGLREPVTLAPGQRLIVPGGEKPFEPRLVHTSAGAAVTVNARPEPGRFVWPCNGAITQYFGTWHLAIDIGNSAGTPIYAGDSGTVTVAGWWGNLGNAVQINHGNGFITTYGHMRAVLVSKGQYVQRGQQIGEMGSTGKSTGPHVHFSVLYYGGYVNPARYLPSP